MDINICGERIFVRSKSRFSSNYIFIQQLMVPIEWKMSEITDFCDDHKIFWSICLVYEIDSREKMSHEEFVDQF